MASPLKPEDSLLKNKKEGTAIIHDSYTRTPAIYLLNGGRTYEKTSKYTFSNQKYDADTTWQTEWTNTYHFLDIEFFQNTIIWEYGSFPNSATLDVYDFTNGTLGKKITTIKPPYPSSTWSKTAEVPKGRYKILCPNGSRGIGEWYFETVEVKRLSIQNENNIYSLSDKTLIHLPDNTNESIIEHGVEQGRYIQLDTPFTKHRYFNDTPVTSVNGKVFTHDIGKINTLSIKELAKNKSFEPIFTWYETNMTSNTAPSPLVASASDQQTGFETYKAFNNLNTASDTWMTNSNIVNGWIQLDLGSSMVFNCVRITSRNGVGYDTHSPKDFEILASNDNNTFTKLGTFNSNTAWKNYEQRAFTFSNTTAYRYYRVDVLSNNGGVIVAINNISFGYKREVK